MPSSFGRCSAPVGSAVLRSTICPCAPPTACNTSPVTCGASVRNSTASTISWASEVLAMGDKVFRNSFGLSLCNGVSTIPGATVFVSGVLHREVSRDRVDSVFGDHRHRCGNTGYGMIDQRRRDAHDAAARFLCQHLPDRQLRQMDETVEVRRGQLSEVFDRVVEERLGDEDARVIDHRIDEAKGLDGCFRHLLCRCWIADIAIDRARPLDAFISIERMNTKKSCV